MNHKSVVYVIDADTNDRRSIARSLTSHGYDVVAFDRHDQFLSSPKANTPACAILDLDPTDTSGFVMDQRPGGDAAMPVIFLSRFPDVPTTVKAMRSGASDFLLKPVDESQLLSSVGAATAQAHEQWAGLQLLRRLRHSYDSLTRCEREVLPYVVRGFLNKQTAFELGKSEITIRIHRAQIMRKMNASSLAELVWFAGGLGIPDRRPIAESPQAFI